MKKSFTILFIFLVVAVQAQSARDTLQAYAYEGLQAYKNSDFALAEKYFRQALQYGYSDTVQYNLAETLYMQKRKNEALKHWEEVIKESVNDSLKADAWHNMGNIYYEKKLYEKAVDAFKNSLRIRPDDDETRYNYALAKQKLKQQKKNSKNNQKNKDKRNKQQNNQNQNKKQNQKPDQKKNKKRDKKENQQKKNGKNPNEKQNKSPENKKNKSNGNDPSGQKNEKRQKQKSKLSPDETKRLLQALRNKENQTLKKVKWKKARPATRKKSDKDW